MKISDLLVAAWSEVKESDIPPELHAVAFGKAVDLLSASRGHIQPGRTSTTSIISEPTRSPEGDGPLARIAHRLGIDVEAASSVFDATDGSLQLVVGQGKLPRRAASATKDIALLVAAGRQAAGIDNEWTPLSVIREACEHYKRLDGPNFASTIKEMENVFSFRGTSRKREVRMTRPAWEKATELVKQMTGEV